MKPTPAEVRAELKHLRAVKPLIPHKDEYGINNYNLHSAQISTLRYGLTMAEIERQYPDLDTQGAAEDARYWLDGGEVLSPSGRWCVGQKSFAESL